MRPLRAAPPYNPPMNFRNPDFSLRQLQYALAIEQEGSFGKAARACGVSQPSLSAQVAKLEEALGVQLFDRQPRSTLPTADGKLLLDRMRGLLGDLKALEQHAQELRDPWGTPLRVGVIPTIAPYLLPRVVPRLATGPHPLRIHWVELQTAACERSLAEHELDAIVIADPSTRAGTESLELGWEDFHLLLPLDHPFQGPATSCDLTRFELLLLEEGHCLRDHTLEVCTLDRVRESPFRATSLPTLTQMVAQGLGCSVLPTSAVRLETSRAPVRTLPLQDGKAGRMLRLIWRAQSPRLEPILGLGEHLRSALQELTEEG